MRSVISEFVLFLSDSVVLTILAKSTVILLLGLVAGALSFRAQASWRHLVFATTFAAVLALPLVVLTIPDVPVEVASAANPVAEASSSITAAIQSTATLNSVQTVIPESLAPAVESWSLPSIGTMLLVAWIVGASFLSLTLLIDLFRVRHFRRHGIPSERLRGLVEDLSHEARMSPVNVLLHEKLPAPVTFGFFKPTVMLPVDAESWGEADLRRALVHELEHIRRGDWATQMAARVACAFYWFHPLIWMTWSRLTFEAERACDDAVVRTTESADYAEQLVSLSRQLSAGRAYPMIGMAKRSDLARRVSSLLDITRRRERVGFAAAAFSVFVGLFVVISIGPLRAVAQVQPKQPVVKRSQPDQPDVKATPSSKAAVSQEDDEDDEDFRGVNRLDSALLKAAERNAVERVKSLLDEGANVNATLPGDGTPLIAAAKEGHLEMARLLFDRGAKPNIGVSGDGNALTNAAREGHIDVVVFLLDRGADINAGVPGDGNALIMAAGEGYLNIVSLLLERGADISKVVPGDENAIIKACEQGQLDVVKLLVSKGADVNSSVREEFGSRQETEFRTPLNMARKNGHTPIVEYLLSVGARK